MEISLLSLTIFLAATFISAFVAGLSGFAFGIVAAHCAAIRQCSL
jgi:hypothetical protein